MYKGRKQHVMFRKLLAACQWGYGGKYDHRSDDIDPGTCELLSSMADQRIKDKSSHVPGSISSDL